MKTNADLTQRAARHIHTMDWEESGMQGVLRKRLDQDESRPPIERVTTVVKFAANSYFKAHSHEGGEEFIVLDGIFSDQHADYPAGSYVRNPVGTKHKPFSQHGCTILVKLWQMKADDQEHVVINTLDKHLWHKLENGVELLSLHSPDYELVEMIKWPAGITLDEQIFNDGVEYFVVEGRFSDEQGTYASGSWLRLPINSKQKIHVEENCLVYRKTGHLRKPVDYPHE